MAQHSDTTPRTIETAFQATERGVLPPARPVLLGTFLKPGGNTALIRTHDGEVRFVTAGDHIGQARVLQITEGRLDLALLNQVLTLRIPGKA